MVDSCDPGNSGDPSGDGGDYLFDLERKRCHCGQPTSLVCGGCYKTAYCSRDHQRSHWLIHKAICTAKEHPPRQKPRLNLTSATSLLNEFSLSNPDLSFDYTGEARVNEDGEILNASPLSSNSRRTALTSTNTSPRDVPCVITTLEGKPLLTLADSGAGACVIGEDTLISRLGETWTRSNLTKTYRTPYFVLGDGSVSSALGKVTISISLAGVAFTITPWVFKKSSYPLILGTDFLRMNRINIDNARDCLHMTAHDMTVPFQGMRPREEPLREPCNVVNTTNLVIESGVEALVDARVLGLPETLTTPGIIAPSQLHSTLKGLFAAYGTVTLKDDSTKLLLANFSPRRLHIPAGTSLASFSPDNPENYYVIHTKEGDTYFKKELNEAVESAFQAARAAESELVPMFFDSLWQDRSPDVKITVKTSVGKQINLCLHHNTRVHEVKRAILSEGIQGPLVFGGKQLDDAKTISDYHIEDGDTIYLNSSKPPQPVPLLSISSDGRAPDDARVVSKGVDLLNLNEELLGGERLTQLKQTLSKFDNYIKDGSDAPSVVKGFECTIDVPPATTPQRARIRRFPPGERRDVAVKETSALLKAKVIRPSKSQWSCAIVLVPKRKGSSKVRFCCDYTLLNKVTTPFAYKMPRMDDVLDSFHGSQWFSAIDLMSGFWALPVKDEHIKYTCFQSPLGPMEWVRAPFGLRNLPSQYASMIDTILQGDADGKPNLKTSCTSCYMDDIFIRSPTFEQHLKDIDSVLSRLCFDYNLTLRASKCSFATNKIEVLGHQVSREGISPLKSKVEAIQELQFPSSRKQLKSFLGLLGFYRRFIKNFAAVASPLHDLLCEKTQFPKTPPQAALAAFTTLKKALMTDCMQAHPNWGEQIVIETDASIYGLGCIISNRPHGSSKGSGKVLQFASRSLQTHEKNYSQTQLEALAVVWALSLFRPFLIGRHFVVISDCSALKAVFGSTADKRTEGRLTRWALRLQEFDYTMEHRPGLKSGNVDYLSRYPTTSSQSPPIEPLYSIVAMNSLAASRDTMKACSSHCSKWEFQQWCTMTRKPSRPKLLRHSSTRHEDMPVLIDSDCDSNNDLETLLPNLAPMTRSMIEAANAHADDPITHVEDVNAQADDSKTRAEEANAHAEEADARANDSDPQSTEAKLKLDHQRKLDRVSQRTQLHDVTRNLAGQLRQAYKDDRGAQNIHKRPMKPEPGTIGYFLDDRKFIRYADLKSLDANQKIVLDHHPLYIPTQLRKSCLHAIHGLDLLGHLGFSKSYPLLRKRFYWPGISRDLKRWIKACVVCRRRKTARKSRQGLSAPMARVAAPFHTLHFDLVGPMPETAEGHQYILTVMDGFTQYPFAVPIKNKEALTVAKDLLKICLDVGNPSVLVSDRAKEFVGSVMKELNNLLDVKHRLTSGLNPQGNLVERFHRFLMAALTVHANQYRRAWDDALPLILFAFRATVSQTTGYSPFMMAHGREARLPVDSLFDVNITQNPDANSYVQSLQDRMNSTFQLAARQQIQQIEQNRLRRDSDEKRVAVVYEPGDLVLVWGPVRAGAMYPEKNKLLYQWSDPMIVHERVDAIHYKLLTKVEHKTSQEWKLQGPVHVNRLHRYEPFDDGSASITVNRPPPPNLWSAPTISPSVGHLVLVKTEADWHDRPFDLGKILHITNEQRQRYIVQWYGNYADDITRAMLPGFVDKKDDFRVFTLQKKRSYKPWTSSTTNTRVTDDKLLLTDVKLSKGNKLLARDLDLLETCPLIEWRRSPNEESLFQNQ